MKKVILAFIFMSFSVSSFALNPVREYSITPGDYGMDYKTVKLKTSDGLQLHAWFFDATEGSSRKCIILSDDGNGNMADLIELASNFLSLGYHVLTFDYRGFGKSDDFKINKKIYIYNQFEKDLNAAISYIDREYGSLKTLHLYGIGIGAGLSIGIGANNPKVSKVIADSPYITFEIVQKRYMEAYGQKVITPLGFNKNVMEPKYALEEKGVGLIGILIIAGSEDLLFTEDDLKELSRIKKKITDTYVVEGANMKTTFTSSKADYFKEIKDFLGV